MRKYDYIIFDLDDTLLNFSQSEYAALKELFARYGVVFNEESFKRYKEINTSLWHALEEGKIKKETVLNQRFERFFATQGIEVEGEKVDEEYRNLLENRNDLMEGALELLDHLTKRGYILLAGTNGVGVTQRKRLANADMREYFKELYISEEVGFEKPSAHFFETIFTNERLVDLPKIVMVGDRLNSDIKGANRVGIDSIWLNNRAEVATDVKPTYECHNLKEIDQLLLHLER